MGGEAGRLKTEAFRPGTAECRLKLPCVTWEKAVLYDPWKARCFQNTTGVSEPTGVTKTGSNFNQRW